jgi:hypothetical protein
MNASIASYNRVPSPQPLAGFGKIGIPAVAAAAEMMKTVKPKEKQVHQDFYHGSD